MPSSSLYWRYETAVIPQALLPDRPKDTCNAGSSRLAVRSTRVRKEQARNELTGCKERERGAPVWVYRSTGHRRRGDAAAYSMLFTPSCAAHAALPSSALYATSVSTRCTRVENPRSRTASAPETRRASLSSLDELHEPQALARHRRPRSYAPLGGYSRRCVSVHKQVKSACTSSTQVS